jgi:two-component system response regulator QseB
VDWVEDGRAAELALAENVHDLLLLDLGLPRRDGLDVLKGMRRRGDARPVLILTARDAVADRVAGLDAGADDYVVKPFDLAELAARIRAVTRRKTGRAQPVLDHAGVTLDPATHEVRRDGQPVALSPREYALLQALLEHPGRILSRAQLEERLYGWGEEVESNVVEVHVHSLRRKLGADFIRNVRGVGYRVAPDAP